MGNEPAVKKGKGGGGGIREYLLLLFLFIFAVFAGLSKKEREELIRVARLGRKIRQGEVSGGEEEILSAFEEILRGGGGAEEEEEEGKKEGEKKREKERENAVKEEIKAEEGVPVAPESTKTPPPAVRQKLPSLSPSPAPAGTVKPERAPPSGVAPAIRVPPEVEGKIRSAFRQYHYGRIKKYVEELGYTYVGKERQGKKLGIVICKEGKIFVSLQETKSELPHP